MSCPDILTLSKTLGAGLPLAAVVTSAEIEQRAHERGFLFFTTHVSDPLVAAVGNTVLDVLERDRLDAARRASSARACAPGCSSSREQHDGVGDVRGRGLLQGSSSCSTGEPRRAPTRSAPRSPGAASTLGLHMNIVQLPGMGGTFRIAPPLTSTEAELDRGRRDPRRGPERRDELISADRRRPRPASASPRPPARRRSSAT